MHRRKKNPMITTRSVLNLFILFFIALFLTGCGGSKLRICASDRLFQENTAKRVAVITEGRVVHPRMGGSPLLSIESTKTALNAFMPPTKDVLTEKKYEVVFCEPIAVGYYSPIYKYNKDNFYIDDIVSYEEKNIFYPIESQKPVFQYPAEHLSEKTTLAIQRIFEQMERLMVERRMDLFQPAAEDINAINAEIGADLIFFNRLYMEKFSAKRKLASQGIAITAALLGAGGVQTLSDKVESYFVVIDTNNGEVLWQRGLLSIAKDGRERRYLERVLSPFPDANQVMDSTKYMN